MKKYIILIILIFALPLCAQPKDVDMSKSYRVTSEAQIESNRFVHFWGYIDSTGVVRLFDPTTISGGGGGVADSVAVSNWHYLSPATDTTAVVGSVDVNNWHYLSPATDTTAIVGSISTSPTIYTAVNSYTLSVGLTAQALTSQPNCIVDLVNADPAAIITVGGILGQAVDLNPGDSYRTVLLANANIFYVKSDSTTTPVKIIASSY